MERRIRVRLVSFVSTSSAASEMSLCLSLSKAEIDQFLVRNLSKALGLQRFQLQRWFQSEFKASPSPKVGRRVVLVAAAGCTLRKV